MFRKKTSGGGGSGGLAAKIAHTTIMPSLVGNKDLKLLQDFITAEKSIVTDLQKLALDYAKAAEALKLWGQGEGDDLGDVLSQSAGMFMHFCDALNRYAVHEQSIRTHLKRIRSEEEDLDRVKKERRSVGTRAESAEKKLQKMTPENKNLQEQTDLLTRLREEMKALDIQIMNEEARLGDFKRQASKDFLLLKFGGLLECAEKSKVVGEFGNALVQAIPLETTVPGNSRVYYNAYEQTQKLASDASRAVSEVTYEPQGSALPLAPGSPGVSSVPASPTSVRANPIPPPPNTIGGYPHQPSAYGGQVDEFGQSGPSAPPRFNTYQASPLSAQSPFAPPPGPPPGAAQPQVPGGSRFATFPAQRRGTSDDFGGAPPPVPPPNDYQENSNHFISPPHSPPALGSPQPTHDVEPSFSDSIADALAADSYLQSLNPEKSGLHQPVADSSHAPDAPHIPWNGSAAAAAPNEPLSHSRQPGGDDAESETGLAYASEPKSPQRHHKGLSQSLDDAYDGSTLWIRKHSETTGAQPGSPRTSLGAQRPGDRHVHYGGVSDDVNNAAQREVSREMDALAFSSAVPRSPPPPNQMPYQNPQAPPGTYAPPPGPPPGPIPPLQNVLTRSPRPGSPETSTTGSHSLSQGHATIPPPSLVPQQSTGGSQYQQQPPTPLAPINYVVPSSPPPVAPPAAAPTPPPAPAPAASQPPLTPLSPPRLNMALVGSGAGGGPPSPSYSAGGTRTISASAFRRPFAKKATMGLAGAGVPEKDGQTLAGPPYSSIPAGEPPATVPGGGEDAGAGWLNVQNTGGRNASNTSLSSTGGSSVSPLNIRNKPRLPSTPHPPASLPPGAQAPRPQPNSGLSAMTTNTAGSGEAQAFYTPNDGRGGAGGGGGGDYFPRTSEDSNATSGRHQLPPYTPSPHHEDGPQNGPGPGGAAIGDIPDEAEFMRELEREEHAHQQGGHGGYNGLQ